MNISKAKGMDMEFLDTVQFQFLSIFFIGYMVGRFVEKKWFQRQKAEIPFIKKTTERLPVNTIQKIDDALDANRKILAIKIFRAKTGFGLKESKMAIDQIIRTRK